MNGYASSIPLHAQAASYMREKIYNHEWAADSQIPTEFELVDTLGMSRGTVKRAIKTLVDEGMLVQVQGKGTFVTNSTLHHPSGNCLISFAESLRSQGISFTTEVIKHEVTKADDFLAGKLFVSTGSPVLLLNRLRRVEDEPVIYFESCLNLTALPGLENVDFEKNNLFATIEGEYGKRIGHSSVQYAARVAGDERGRLLEVDPAAPVLHLEQQIFLSDNTSAEWSNVWLRGDRYSVGTSLMRV